jgi:hypothetical protein
MSSSSSDGSAFQVLRAVDGVRRSESTAGGSERFNSWLPGRDTAQHSPESYRVIGGVGVVVIIEIDPRAFRAAGLNPARPYRELGLRVIVPVPTLAPMQADVNLIGVLTSSSGRRGPLQERKMIPALRKAL